MLKRILKPTVLILILSSAVVAQDGNANGLDGASRVIQRRLENSVKELSELRERLTQERLPLLEKRKELRGKLAELQKTLKERARVVDATSLALGNLATETKNLEDEFEYISNLFSQYTKEFRAGLHITEWDRFREVLETAELASENQALTPVELLSSQIALVRASLERLHDVTGGVIFPGKAVDADGVIEEGDILLLGPMAVFRSTDGSTVGLADEKLNSLQPSVAPFPAGGAKSVVSKVFAESRGRIFADPTLGDAQKLESTKETMLEEIEKGGPVMVPIFLMAGLASLIALYKWLTLAFMRMPSKKAVQELLDAVGRGDLEDARGKVALMRGPAGTMLAAGIAHVRGTKELIEEVMFEKVLAARLRMQQLLPFIAICAASAPLLGLLGTVSGIINTFKMITLFGSGDVKSLSGGISEALITTKYGLIVAIPALIVHAFLARKVKGAVGKMETMAVGLMNEVGKSSKSGRWPGPGPLPAVTESVGDVPVRASSGESVDQEIQERGFEAGDAGLGHVGV